MFGLKVFNLKIKKKKKGGRDKKTTFIYVNQFTRFASNLQQSISKSKKSSVKN